MSGNVNAEQMAAGAMSKNPDLDGIRDEKKYSDNDVDAIVARKIARERARYESKLKNIQGEAGADPVEQRALDLDIRERKLKAREALPGMKLPESYLDLLNYGSDEALETSTAAVQKFIDDLLDQLVIEKSKGSTPKNYGKNRNPDMTREAFGL